MDDRIPEGQIIETILYLIDEDPRPNILFGAPALDLGSIAAHIDGALEELHPGRLCAVIQPLCDSLFDIPRVPAIRFADHDGYPRQWLVFEDSKMKAPAPSPLQQKLSREPEDLFEIQLRPSEDETTSMEERRNRLAQIVLPSPSAENNTETVPEAEVVAAKHGSSYMPAKVIYFEDETNAQPRPYGSDLPHLLPTYAEDSSESDDNDEPGLMVDLDALAWQGSESSAMEPDAESHKPANDRPATLWEMGDLLVPVPKPPPETSSGPPRFEANDETSAQRFSTSSAPSITDLILGLEEETDQGAADDMPHHSIHSSLRHPIHTESEMNSDGTSSGDSDQKSSTDDTVAKESLATHWRPLSVSTATETISKVGAASDDPSPSGSAKSVVSIQSDLETNDGAMTRDQDASSSTNDTHSRVLVEDTEPVTPWVTKTFADLPFGPEMEFEPSFHAITRQWRVLAAQVVLILGLAYLIQASGL